ncbi:MAG: hypothetical protein Mars2KO_08900 [Maribacter sp.]|uniref:DUF6515 family protein n=1 Tax=Maribacter sp. 2307UL18-2 TaxID=3386274 RepID=UPI0039BD2CAA
MKNLKVVLAMILVFGMTAFATAQRKVVKVYPKHGTVVTKVYNPKVVVHNKVRFHFADGVWYKPRGKRFVVCAAPVGIQVRHLPRGNKVVKLRNGRKVYKYKGVWYKKKGRGYVVVNV